MKQFKYNPEDLTQEQRDKIAAVMASCDDTLKRLEAEEDARMERYYNCEDDYSWGGLCSKANYQARNRAMVDLEESIEMIVRGGFIVRQIKRSVLKAKDSGEIVSSRIHDGKYGPCFVVEDGDSVKFVGCAKQLSTFEKKGYVPYVQTVTEKLVPKGWWSISGDRKYITLETVVNSEEISTQFVF